MSLRLLAANARPPLRHLSRSLSTSPQSSSSGSVRRTLYAATFAASAGLFAVYYLDARSALHEHIVNPILRNALDAETAHKLALKVLRSGFAPKDPLADDDRLAVHVCRVSSQRVNILNHFSFGVKNCQTLSDWLPALTRMGKPLMVCFQFSKMSFVSRDN